MLQPLEVTPKQPPPPTRKAPLPPFRLDSSQEDRTIQAHEREEAIGQALALRWFQESLDLEVHFAYASKSSCEILLRHIEHFVADVERKAITTPAENEKADRYRRDYERLQRDQEAYDEEAKYLESRYNNLSVVLAQIEGRRPTCTESSVSVVDEPRGSVPQTISVAEISELGHASVVPQNFGNRPGSSS